MLTELLREHDPSLSLLRRRALVASSDRSTFDAWASRLLSMLSGPAPAARRSACLLLAETVKQSSQSSFARHREAWTTALLKLLQPPASASRKAASAAAAAPANDKQLAATRLAASEALVVMIDAAKAWPAERRELAGLVSRVAASLVNLVTEPACQHGAVAILARLCACAPHGLRVHRERLGELLPAIILDARAPSARDAAVLLAALPSSLPAAAFDEAWLLTVQQLCGTLERALVTLLGSATSRSPLQYTLPAYELPFHARTNSATGADPVRTASRRTALLRCVRRCVMGLHCCLSPGSALCEGSADGGGGGGSGNGGSAAERGAGVLPVPMDMLVQLAAHALSVDGALAQRLQPEGAIAHGDLLCVLPDLHVAAWQLLHTTLLAARRHALPHTQLLVGLLRRSWTLTGSAGPSYFHSTVLRSASYAFAGALIATFGPCTTPSLAESLAHACAVDLTARASAVTDGPAGAGDADARDPGGQRKRAKKGARGGGGGGGGGADVPCINLAVQFSALQALRCLLQNGSDLISAGTLDAVHRLLLRLCWSNPPIVPPLHALAIATLHSSVASGRTLHVDVLPRAVAACQQAAVHGESEARSAAHAALHAFDALLHPCGVLVWGAPPPEPELRSAAASASRAHAALLRPGAGAGGATLVSDDGASSQLGYQHAASHLMGSRPTQLATAQSPSDPVPPPPQLAAAGAHLVPHLPNPPAAQSARPVPMALAPPAFPSSSAAPLPPSPATASGVSITLPTGVARKTPVAREPPPPAWPAASVGEAHDDGSGESDVELVDVGPDESDAPTG